MRLEDFEGKMRLEDFEGKTLYVKVEKKRRGRIGKARELRNVKVIPLKGHYQLVVRGYPRKGKVVSFYVDPQVLKFVKKRAQEEGLNFSLFVRRLLFRERLTPLSSSLRGRKARASISLSEEEYRRLKELTGKSMSSYIAEVLNSYYILEKRS